MKVFGMEQELQELRVAPAALADQLRIQNELLTAKDAQIAVLTEKIAELATLKHLFSSNSDRLRAGETLKNITVIPATV